MSTQHSKNPSLRARANTGLQNVSPRELLTEAERERLAARGPGFIGWARRVRAEQLALDELLSGNDEPSNLVPFGRRSSSSWG